MADGLKPNRGMLVFELKEDGSMMLLLIAPTINQPFSIAPSIGVSFVKKGKFDVVMGNEKTVFTPAMLPAELRKFLLSPPNTKDASMKLPPCSLLKNEKGGFKTFPEYSRLQRQTDIPYREPLPELTPDIYKMMVDLYQSGGYACQ